MSWRIDALTYLNSTAVASGYVDRDPQEETLRSVLVYSKKQVLFLRFEEKNKK